RREHRHGVPEREPGERRHQQRYEWTVVGSEVRESQLGMDLARHRSVGIPVIDRDGLPRRDEAAEGIELQAVWRLEAAGAVEQPGREQIPSMPEDLADERESSQGAPEPFPMWRSPARIFQEVGFQR